MQRKLRVFFHCGKFTFLTFQWYLFYRFTSEECYSENRVNADIINQLHFTLRILHPAKPEAKDHDKTMKITEQLKQRP